MNKAQVFLKKHSSTILSIVGATGVVATSVLSVRATPKALSLLVEAEQDKGGELTVVETIKAAWKPYVPAVITGASTIACILGANYLSTRAQASLMSAYALLDSYHKEYRAKTKELYPEEATKFEHKMIKTKLNHNIELEDNKELFYDYQSMRDFQSTFEDVKHAEYLLNEKLSKEGFACLNDLYDFIGIPHVPYGYQLGWSTIESDEVYSKAPLELIFDKAVMDDGLECNIMSITYPDSLKYIC